MVYCSQTDSSAFERQKGSWFTEKAAHSYSWGGQSAWGGYRADRCFPRGKRTTNPKSQQGKVWLLRGIMVVFTVLVCKDCTEYPEMLCNLSLWRYSKPNRTRFKACPVLNRRLQHSRFPAQIFIWCQREKQQPRLAMQKQQHRPYNAELLSQRHETPFLNNLNNPTTGPKWSNGKQCFLQFGANFFTHSFHCLP